VTVRSEAGGLEASLQVTSGPYFLSELLAVTVTFTNHSNKSVLLQGLDAPLNFCNGAFSLASTGGSEPHYNFSLDEVVMSCPDSQTKLDPGKSLMIHGYVPLTKSGLVMLTPGARFLPVAKDHGMERISSGHSPLDGHWPTMHINVATKIPTDRTLSLQQQNSSVIINAPVSVSHNLVYYYVVTCVGTMGTSARWYPVTTLMLHEPECSGLNKHWTYAVGAPGYAIASGEISY